MELNVQGLQYFACDKYIHYLYTGFSWKPEDILFTANDVSMATWVIAVKLANENGQQMMGMTSIDAMLQKLGVCQFSDSEQLSNVEVRIIIYINCYIVGPVELCKISSYHFKP